MTTPSPIRGHDAPIEYHRRLLDDVARMAAFERAIRLLVKPGDVVLDVGSGTGILAMLAARAGAARVHAVESMSVATVAAALVRDNGLDGRVTVHRADIVAMEPIEPVDLVVSEFMGRVVVDDAMFMAMGAAADWLKPKGRFCPGHTTVFMAPVGDFPLRPIDLWYEEFYGLRVDAALPWALNTCYHVRLHPGAVLATPQSWVELTLGQSPLSPDYTEQLSFTIERDGTLRGFAGWFRAQLAPDVVLETRPGVETHWDQYLFTTQTTEVKKGDVLDLELAVVGEEETRSWFTWQATLTRDGVLRDRFAYDSRGPGRTVPV